jgi:tRNA A58 N-methylase Trm61
VSVPAPAAAASDASLLQAGDSILLIDRKRRVYLRRLQAGGRVSVRGTPVPADSLIGRPEGSMLRTDRGETFLVLRPTYAELIPNLPRSAQPIYPKDVGIVLLWGDIARHARRRDGVIPARSLWACCGPRRQRTLVSYERRDDFAAAARENVSASTAPNWTVRVADASLGLAERDVDRIVVDVPEPWTLLDVIARACVREVFSPASSDRAAGEAVGRRIYGPRRVRRRPDVGNSAASLGRERTEHPPGASHGRTHRLPRLRAPPGARRERLAIDSPSTL